MVSSVYIAKNVYGGDGLGRLGDGRVVFVPGAWAGEQVRAELADERKRFVRAKLVEVVEASPERLAAPDGDIPGMTYAGLSYRGECRAKEAQLREFFERARIPVGDFRGMQCADAPSLNYRNKVVYHFARQGGRWAIGYRAEPSHELVDVERDPLAVEEINRRLPEIRRAVTALLTSGPAAVRRDAERKGVVTVRWTRKSGVKWWIGDAPDGMTLKETSCGRDFEVPAGGFWQVNPAVGEALVKAVAEEYARGRDETPEVLDLYCGVGVFGLCCNPVRLTGIESGRQAIEFARRNAAAQASRNPPGAVRDFRAAQVGRSLRRIAATPRTMVVADPPRGGMEPGVPQWLAQSGAPRICCVGCDPATLIRDLRILARTYEVESVRWFNMFPRTARFETLAVLKRRR